MQYDAEKVMNIYQAANRAIDAAFKVGEAVDLVFNDLTIRVSPRSHADDIAMIYSLKHEIRRLTK